MTQPTDLLQWPHRVTLPEELGGKAGALWKLGQAGFQIPEWFVIPPGAIAASRQGDSPWEHWQPDESLLQAVEAAVLKLCPEPGQQVAFRSSGLDEDGAVASFAGQFESVLGVDGRDRQQIIAAITMVVRSGFAERVRAYRLQQNLAELPTIPAVLVQRMIRADAAGVGFSCDPVTGSRATAVVCAVRGLGSALVNGESGADTFRVRRDGKVMERIIVDKPVVHRAGKQGQIRTEHLGPRKAAMPAISRKQAREVASLARRCARHFGRAQDIEWALERDQLYLLQSRPITTLGHIADPDGVRQIWDNSNIAESYAGITLPMTFSFARYVYEHVYRQFCLMMGVTRDVVADHHAVFANMLGTAQGRVYYNLINWYRLLAMLPGFQFNRAFMEQMMGVKEPIPEEVIQEATKAGKKGKWRDGLSLLRTVAGLMVGHLTIRRSVEEFQQRLDAALAPTQPPLDQMRLDQLTTYYRQLERQLLTRWDAPLVNDFLAMIFHGLLRKLTTKWIGQTHGAFHNDLIAHQGFIISAEPVSRLRELAQQAMTESQTQPGLLETLDTGNAVHIARVLVQTPQLKAMGERYLRQFGDRCSEELKLESLTLADNPGPLWQTVSQLARRMASGQLPDARAMQQRQQQLQVDAQNVLREKLARHPLRRVMYHWVLRHARNRVRDRENLRFGRTRLFGRVRRILLAAGARMSENGALEQPRDVFYLHLDEVLGYAEGTLTLDSPDALAKLRSDAYSRYATWPAPADRFETRGAFLQGNRFESVMQAQPAADGVDAADANTRTGLGCCPGLVKGKARVIHDPRGAVIHEGEILVASRTDPGWVLLFPGASGVLVEHGSLLSHSAIVARELGLPAVVSIPGLMSWLEDGDLIEFNGSTGQIRRLGPEEQS